MLQTKTAYLFNKLMELMYFLKPNAISRSKQHPFKVLVLIIYAAGAEVIIHLITAATLHVLPGYSQLALPSVTWYSLLMQFARIVITFSAQKEQTMSKYRFRQFGLFKPCRSTRVDFVQKIMRLIGKNTFVEVTFFLVKILVFPILVSCIYPTIYKTSTIGLSSLMAMTRVVLNYEQQNIYKNAFSKHFLR